MYRQIKQSQEIANFAKIRNLRKYDVNLNDLNSVRSKKGE